ncbi:hypothetical protein FEDK69T_29960 [Flavobacterium enshiense DK69]|uniref:Uncharacterized protein n=1 Tax=Flavobacterium enshiense DK69 TaxID=1107311 RepID=V6S1B9_9FLAO|nr:hypothetical protein [Flavobacterium enshiense]ESU20473.1 hypothetical protein FEDK69T_29960 [Flavobacterium enshiense DK69]KGO95723.1 hypothetical protein Q767_08490 [Flavobacterium enshiense DK69]
MKKVTKIEWTFHTSNQEGSGTDSQVTIKIFRDGDLLAFINQEPGETARLDRGENGTYWWVFKNPTRLGTAESGQVVPYTENFPNGVQGHLKVQFEIWGDDAWRIGTIESKVVSGEKVGIPGTIDSWSWKESSESFVFNGEDVLSSNSSEGIRKLNLNY